MSIEMFGLTQNASGFTRAAIAWGSLLYFLSIYQDIIKLLSEQCILFQRIIIY
jgi:hypothetical protein